MAVSESRNETVDALRGFAALAVCLYHFSNSAGPFASISALTPVAAYGKHGVEVFFVISGFIVPYAMARANYSLAIWHRFMAKRLIRLEPPYLVSIAVVIAIGLAASASPWFRGPAPDYSLMQIATHLGYLNAYIGAPWLNPVYWSLAIEFQYYLLMALIFPALVGGSTATRLLVVAALSATALAAAHTGEWFIATHLPVFSAGILTFLVAEKLVRAPQFWAALGTLAIFLLYVFGISTALAAIAPAIVMATVRLPRIGALAWLGAISYSLYLLHIPIGTRVVNIAGRFGITPAIEVIAILLALAASLAAAYGLYRLVEEPSRKASKCIAYATDVKASQGIRVEGRT